MPAPQDSTPTPATSAATKVRGPDLIGPLLYPARLNFTCGSRRVRGPSAGEPHVSHAVQRSPQEQPDQDQALPREAEGEEPGPAEQDLRPRVEALQVEARASLHVAASESVRAF